MNGDLVGTQLGKYQIQAEIGKGGMGIVYLGYDPALARKVAVKVLAPHLVWESEFVERFLREARTAAQLKHAGIVTIYDIGQAGNWHYIVMEYLEGQTLAQIIYQQGPLPPDLVMSIAHQLAGALDYAHHKEVIHRDVKPGNIMIAPSGQATLTDFGVARAAQETGLTATGALVGTPQYMSPEQARGDEINYRADIYSLGVVVYEMLAGRAPFGATTPHAVLHQLIFDPPPPIKTFRTDLPADVDRALGKGLDKEPARRYETAAELVRALGKSLAYQGSAGQEGPASVPPGPATEILAEPVPPPAVLAAVSAPMADAAAADAPVADESPVKARPFKRQKAQAQAPSPAAGSAKPGMGLWLGWLLASVLGWVAGWLLGTVIVDSVGWIIAENLDMFAIEMIFGAIIWGLMGLVTGLGQWLVLRRHLQKAGWWIVATAIGFAVVGSLKWGQGMVMESIFVEFLDPIVDELGGLEIAPLFGIGLSLIFDGLTGLVIGVAQWLALQNRVARAGRWPWISVLAWVAAAMVLGVVNWVIGETDEETMGWIVAMIIGPGVGLVTATGMVRLLPNRLGLVDSGT